MKNAFQKIRDLKPNEVIICWPTFLCGKFIHLLKVESFKNVPNQISIKGKYRKKNTPQIWEQIPEGDSMEIAGQD